MLDFAISTLLNVLLFAVLPFVCFRIAHKRRQLGFDETLRRAGLALGEPRYLVMSAAVAAVLVVGLLLAGQSADASMHEGSAFEPFAGLGLSGVSVTMALLYGVLKTGFAEELLFRGLIAGSLARKLELRWANLLQALVFLAPHALVLLVAPEQWIVLPVVFVVALLAGWLRIVSGSIIGPWIIHASANVTMALLVATHTTTAGG